MTTTASTSAERVPWARLIFGVGAAVGLVIAVVDALVIQSALPPSMTLLSGDLRRDVWLSWCTDQVPLVLLPALAAASLRDLSRLADPASGRPASWPVVGACTWLAGVVVAQWRWWGGDADGGWFNVAPDLEAFSPGGVLAAQHVGLAIAWVGLTVAAAALASVAARSFRRAPDGGSRSPSVAAAGLHRVLAASQLIVLVIGPVVVARLVWLLATRPGWWGRT